MNTAVWFHNDGKNEAGADCSEHLQWDTNLWHQSRMNEFNAGGLCDAVHHTDSQKRKKKKNKERGDKSEGLRTESTNTD